MPAISNMPRDYMAIAGSLAAQFSVAQGVDAKISIWCATLNIADNMLAHEPRNFNRNDFYFLVFGTRDHFAARDEIYRAHANSASIPAWMKANMQADAARLSV
jgi:hypothetical protein